MPLSGTSLTLPSLRSSQARDFRPALCCQAIDNHVHPKVHSASGKARLGLQKIYRHPKSRSMRGERSLLAMHRGSPGARELPGPDQRMVAPPKSSLILVPSSAPPGAGQPANSAPREPAGRAESIAWSQSARARKSPAAQAERASAMRGQRIVANTLPSTEATPGRSLNQEKKSIREDDSNRDGKGRRHEAIPRVHSRCRKRWSH